MYIVYVCHWYLLTFVCITLFCMRVDRSLYLLSLGTSGHLRIMRVGMYGQLTAECTLLCTMRFGMDTCGHSFQVGFQFPHTTMMTAVYRHVPLVPLGGATSTLLSFQTLILTHRCLWCGVINAAAVTCVLCFVRLWSGRVTWCGSPRHTRNWWRIFNAAVCSPA